MTRLTRHTRAPLGAGRRCGAVLQLFALAVLFATAMPARATTVVAKSFADLCAEADLVFAGTVTGVETAWADAAKQAIETRVTFGDLTWLRGGPQATLTLRFAGGTLDGLSEEIAGVPRFATGDRVVIFARNGEFISPIVGFHQGLYRVVDGARGPAVVDAEGHPVTGVSGAAVRRGTPAAAPGAPLSLDAFLDGVRGQLNR